MQIQWTSSFMQRMLFNASKAYVHQLQKGEQYHLLKPVYGLGLINSQFDPNPNDWYHHYKIVNIEKPQCEIKDLQLVFIELPKFKAKTRAEKKLQILWLRFLSELGDDMHTIPEEWLHVPEIERAVHLAEEAAYTPEELAAYEKYWDWVSTEKTLITGFYEDGLEQGRVEGLEAGLKKGLKKGLEKGLEKGLAKGLAKGRAEGQQQIKQMQLQIARSLKQAGLSDALIADHTDLPMEEIIEIS
jgi:predicted transposase/invertase (TIGR01784 family)